MGRIECESLGLGRPGFADGFVGCAAFERLQSSAEVVYVDEVVEVSAELVVGVVVEAFDGCFLERPLHSFDLAIGPRVSWLGEPVVDVILGAGVFKGVREELLAVIYGAADIGGCRSGVSG